MDKQTVCPECGAAGEKKIKGRERFEGNADRKQAIISGEYFEWQCPGCDKRFFINSPFLYYDAQKAFMVYFVPGYKETFYKIPTVVRTDKNYDTHGSRLRMVSGFTSFVEKIRIFETGLDDRIVEMIKLLYINMHIQDSGEKVYDMVFENADENGDLYFGVYLESEDYEQLIPKSVLDNTTAEFSSMLPPEVHDGFTVVDQSWVAKVMNKEN